MPIKFLMYSHDGYGLGHFYRLLKLSAFLQAEVRDLSILLLAECRISGLRLPPRVDYVKFPGVLAMRDIKKAKSLPLSFDEVIEIRKQIIFATALAYQPHLFLVDFLPTGVANELLPSLLALKRGSSKTKLIYGLRDIIGDKDVLSWWLTEDMKTALEELYDEIWVYGCKALYDPVKEYQLPNSIAKKVRYCGYLGIEPTTRPREELRRILGIETEKFVLVTVGYGWDGFPVLDTYLNALELLPEDVSFTSLLITGPGLPPEQRDYLRRRCHQITSNRRDRRQRINLLEFSVRLLDYMAAADVVVTRGGYNTVCEILSLEKQAVIVPRTYPNQEQLIRASLFDRLGLIRMLHPDHLSPETMAQAILAAFHASPPSRQRLSEAGLDLNGLQPVKDHYLRLATEIGKPG